MTPMTPVPEGKLCEGYAKVMRGERKGEEGVERLSEPTYRRRGSQTDDLHSTDYKANNKRESVSDQHWNRMSKSTRFTVDLSRGGVCARNVLQRSSGDGAALE